MKFLNVAVILIAFAGALRAQDASSGTWEGETPSGTPIVLNLAVKGAALSGTLVRSGDSTTPSDGKVPKTTFTSRATVNGQAEAFSGELAGDEVKIWMDRQGASKAIVLRRAKRK